MRRPVEKTAWRGKVKAAFAAFLVLWIMGTGAALAGEAGTEGGVAGCGLSEILSFADALAAQGEYYRAVTEYKRFLHLAPEDPRAARARLAMAGAYFKGEQYADAARELEALLTAGADGETAEKARALTCECLARQGDTEGAGACFAGAAKLAGDARRADALRFRQGFLRVEEGEYGKAREVFSGLTEAGQEEYKISPLLLALTEGEKSLDLKSPRTAGALSIVPGLGHVYLGRKKDAFVAFLITGATALAAWECFDEGQEALGGLVILAGSGFYGGSMYGAVSGAHKHNRRVREGFARRLREGVEIGLGASWTPEGGVVGVGGRF
jgi:hypothetical protein